MGKSELQTSYADWNKRVAKYEAAGIPNQVWAPIAQEDMNRTYTQGGTGMSNAEADTAVFSAWQGKSGVAEQPRHKGGILGDIETIAANVIPDVGNIITSLPRGLATLGKDIVTPSTYTNTGKDISAALKELSTGQYGQGIRDIAQSPLLDLIPGIADVSDLTTSQGRQSLLEHPVTAALDVLPITKPLSSLTGAALGIEEGSAGAAGALRAGKPLSAALQGIDAQALGGRAGRLTSKAIESAKLDAKNTALSTLMNQGQLAGQHIYQSLTKPELDTIFKELGDDPNKLVSFTEKATQGATEAMTPEELTVYDKVQAKQAQIADLGISRGELVKLDEGIYERTSPVVKAFNGREKAFTKVKEAERNAAIEFKSVMNANTARAQAIISKDPAKISEANKRLLKAQQRYAASYKVWRDSKDTHAAADATFQRKLIKNPPPHLHEWIKADFKTRVQKAYTNNQLIERNIPIKNAAELTQISEYNEAMKQIATTPIMDRMYDYVGRKETEALFADSVNEGIKLAKEGLSPVYIHTMRSSALDDIQSLHLAREKDLTESQFLKKSFNLQSSVMNMRASLTRQMLNIIERDGMQKVYEEGLAPHQKTLQELEPIYRKAAEASRHKVRGISLGRQTMNLLDKEWVKFDFSLYGIQRPGTIAKSADIYIPKSLADNLQSFSRGGGMTNALFQNKAYRTAMKVFRTSVLYGPRHFAHVVIGGIMPLLLDDPLALTHFPELWGMFKDISTGRPFSGEVNGQPLPPAITSHFDYKEDAGYKMLQTKVGSKYGELLKDYWNKTGAVPGRGLANIENAAQSMYQAAVYLRDTRKGIDPIQALEHARKLVVNLDTLSPFERTVMKQIFPFYSFTRFATKFLVQLPFDHPLRVAILSQLSTQAQEEWGTGLPQTMMSLFFIGEPDSKGNSTAINFRNLNPFRSISNTFTLAGFMQSLNPMLLAPFVAAGYNPMTGSGQLYPEIVYNAQTGNLAAAHPKGDLMTAAEQFVPELGVVDSFFGISDNLRSLKANDPQAFDRQLFNMLNIPFQVSQYNLPQVRGRVAENAYKGAQNALSQYKKSGDYANTIGRYNLIPYNGSLIPPQQFQHYWEAIKAQYEQSNPGASPAALIPKITPPTTNILSQLEGYYGNTTPTSNP